MLAILLAAAAGCQSSTGLEIEAGAADGGGVDVAPGFDACDPYASSSMPYDLCAVDSDCHNAYLFCGQLVGSTTACRDADAAVADGCAPRELADLPTCPATIDVTLKQCGVRYQRPCRVDADCGPALTCVSSQPSTCPTGMACGNCQAPSPVTCVTKTDCPKEWDCYAACACTPNEQTYCFPPFEIFRCPECAPTPAP
jgi:hypothetical protein